MQTIQASEFKARCLAASAAVRNATRVMADEKLLAWNSALPRLDARH